MKVCVIPGNDYIPSFFVCSIRQSQMTGLENNVSDKVLQMIVLSFDTEHG